MEIKTNVRHGFKKALAVLMSVIMFISCFGVNLSFAADKEAKTGKGTKTVGVTKKRIPKNACAEDCDCECHYEEGNITSGDCGFEGDDVRWSFDEETGTLTISGEGYMNDYYYVHAEEYDSYVAPYLDTVYDEELGYYVSEDYKIKHVVIEEGVCDVGAYAFYNCKALETVSLPATLETLWEDAFAYCSAITEFTLSEENEYYDIVDGCLTYFDGWVEADVLEYYPMGLEAEEFTVPEDIGWVAYTAFSGSENLKRVIIPNPLTEPAYIYSSSVEEIVGYPYSSAHDTALSNEDGPLTFTPINDVDATVEVRSLPYCEDVEVGSEYFDDTGIEIYVTCSDGTEYPVLYYTYDFDFSEIGTATVDIYACGEYISSFDVTVRDRNYLIEGTPVNFTLNSDNSTYLYFTPDETTEYIFTWEADKECYFGIEQYIYDEFWEIDEYVEIAYGYFGEDDEKKVIYEFEEGGDYRIYLYVDYYRHIKDEFTMTVQKKCCHENTTEHAQKDPTCTEGGYTKGVYCDDCGVWVEGHDEIDPIAHIYTETYIIDVAPTCVEAGSQSKHCVICGEKTDSVPVEAKGHTMDKGTVEKEATYTSKGLIIYRCTDCGNALDTKEIPMLEKPVTEEPTTKPEEPEESEKAEKPAKVTIKNVKSSKKRNIIVKWKKVADAEGYEVKYSTAKKFKKNTTKTKTVKKGTATKTTIRKLKSGKKYFVKVRAYKTVNGQKLYGAYSKAKNVVVK